MEKHHEIITNTIITKTIVVAKVFKIESSYVTATSSSTVKADL